MIGCQEHGVTAHDIWTRPGIKPVYVRMWVFMCTTAHRLGTCWQVTFASKVLHVELCAQERWHTFRPLQKGIESSGRIST